MSETSSDAESSCGWTIISNEGSDIETLGSEAAVEYGADLLERPPVVETELQDTPAAASAGCDEDSVGDSLDGTVGEQTVDETLNASKTRDSTPGKEHVTLSSSDHSDIVTLGDVKEDEHAEVEEVAAAHEDFYLGTSCSSQYAFTAAETVFPGQQSVATNSSSSEDEAAQSSTTVVRRRRLRRNTTNIVTEPKEEEEEEEEEHGEVRPAAPDVRMRGQGSSIFNTCLLLVVIAVSMGFGHFYVHNPKTISLVSNLIGPAQSSDCMSVHSTSYCRKLKISAFSVLCRLKSSQQDDICRRDMIIIKRQKTEEKVKVDEVMVDAEMIENSLTRGDLGLDNLDEQPRGTTWKSKELPGCGDTWISTLKENEGLRDKLERGNQLIQSFQGEQEDMIAEAQLLRNNLDMERKVTEELRTELNLLRGRITGDGSEAEELQLRLMELEKRLSYEQQRSDLWERLYVETKEERAKGDTEPKVKKSKEGMSGRVKDTFDAVKNSTKEFVHHHKEQIKKAKEAVKENLRKFSDSVKSTFRHFKDSASTFINKARGFYNKKYDEKNRKESWQHRYHRPHHRHSHKSDNSFQSNHNTRKSGDKAHKDRGQSTHKANPKGCSGVFDCADQESMSLFNKAIEPIRADEFHQLLESYLQQEVDHFHHWKELEMFINTFFHNGVFIHDQMLFTDFVSGVENYLTNMREYHGLDDDLFRDLDDYVYRHFFGDTYTKIYGPSGPFEKPDSDSKEESRTKHQQRKQQRARPRLHSERKWSRSGRNADRHMADVKIELGPMPFDPKY
ncbi:hypothetical protein PAMP_000557 [Pampus punctatissimus]